MSVGLILIANIKTPFNNFQKVAEKLVDKLNTMLWHNAKYDYTFDKNGNPKQTIKENSQYRWQIMPAYDESNEGDAQFIEIDSFNYDISNIMLFENVCVMSVLDRYRDIYRGNKHFKEFQIFRNKLFEILTFLNGSEIIYLPDSSYRLSMYLDLPYENKSYNEIKRLIIQETPKQQTNYFDLSYTNNEENEFFLDDFNDLKTGKPYPIKNKALILGYLNKFQDLDKRIERLAYYLKTNISYKKYSQYKIPNSTVTNLLVSNKTFTKNATLVSRVSHYYENSFKWSDFVLKDENDTPIYKIFPNCYKSNIEINNFPELIKKLKAKDIPYLAEFNKKRNLLKTELAIFNCEYALYIYEQKLSETDIQCYIKDSKDVAKERFRTTIKLNLSDYLLEKTEFNKDQEILVIYDDFKDL